jgi:predicted lipoprotein with Yx(FWY)xxD motif
LRAAAAARNAAAAVAVVSVVAFALLGVDVAVGQGGSGQPSGSTAGQALGTTTIGGAQVLTNAKGLTLYWFAPDTSSASKCTGSCAQYWPPVFGKPTAGSGVTGTLSTISRPDGTTQATYDGHPLYTYIGDSSRGQASGNNLDLNGGLWHIIPISG